MREQTGELARLAWRPDEVARMTGQSVHTIYRAIAAGDLSAVRRGRRYLVPDSAARAYAGEAQAT